ncbi:hypothetical protein HUJ05_007654 [Dendroctonus ponderosae]|nr:hypothetical protein HUJ05_007654 [Dendroctonus ponderosae]
MAFSRVKRILLESAVGKLFSSIYRVNPKITELTWKQEIMGRRETDVKNLSQFAIQITIIDLQTELYPNRTYLWLSGAFGENRAFLILRRENPEEQRDGEAGRCETIPGNAEEMRNTIIGSSAN